MFIIFETFFLTWSVYLTVAYMSVHDVRYIWKHDNKCEKVHAWYNDATVCNMGATHWTHWPWAWWCHQMETFSVLLAICAGNSPVPGEFPAQRPVTRSFDVFFDLRTNRRLSKQWRGWWFETQSRSLWRHRNGKKLTVIMKLLFSSTFVW